MIQLTFVPSIRYYFKTIKTKNYEKVKKQTAAAIRCAL